MKALKVKRFRVHTGINIAGQVRTSFDSEQQQLDMHLTESGVYVVAGAPWNHKVVPFGNLIDIDVEAEVKEKTK